VVTPYVVDATVHHRRTRPFDYGFRHRTTAWLVDASAPNAAFPRWLRPLARIRARDHLGPGDAPLVTKLRGYLRAEGLGWTAHTVRVLTNARTAGYAFDPLTTYFCFAADGTLEGIVAEVHNTYGEQHCYPLPAEDRSGAAAPAAGLDRSVDKEFYVSPFFTVDGRYDIRARLTDTDVAVTITLTQGEERVFTGSVVGTLAPATPGRVVRAVARNPLASQRVTALIRWHGIRLWLRRLPVVPRRPHPAPRGTR
jgi:DUF1365 family protein